MKTVNGEETVYTYNALNQLVSDSETSYEYDLNGNLVRVIGSAQSALYEYNAENKLIKATVQNGSLVIEESYTYDYEGNRTSKSTHKSNGEFEYTKYLNDNSNLTNVLAEIDENGTAKCTYTIGADLISQERDGRTSFYLYDGHGSVVGLANEGGVVTDTYSYDAFGNLLKSKGSTENCYRYCGEQFDETSGLYYLRARYMDTSTGRFISQDSYAGSISDPVSLHKYLYANANPVMYSDPSGYMALTQVAAIGMMAICAAGIVYCAMNVLNSLLDTFKKDEIYENDRISFWDSAQGNVSIIDYARFYLFFLIASSIASLGEQTRDIDDDTDKEKTTDLAPPSKGDDDNGRTYYHATSVHIAGIILSTLVISGGNREAGRVFAWERKPTRRVVKNSGAASYEALVEFETLAAFEPDDGIEDGKILKYRPVKAVFYGPIRLTSAKIVPFAWF